MWQDKITCDKERHMVLKDLPQLIRFNDLKPILGGIHRRTLSRWEQLGKFPKHLKIGEKAIAWKVEDIQKWLESKKD